MLKKSNFIPLTRKGSECLKYSDGREEWFLNGIHHRVDGPARIYPDGDRVWFLNGNQLQPHQVEKMKHLLACDLNELPLYINTEFRSVVEWRLKQNA